MAAALHLDDLDDACQLRLFPADPPLDAGTWGRLSLAIDKLFSQFAREGRVAQWANGLEAGGCVIAMAWNGSEPLSGCSHDRLARLTAAFETDGQRVLSAPPILVEVDGRVRCFTRPAARSALHAGLITPQSTCWDLGFDTLGGWRQSGRRPLVETPVGHLLCRPRSVSPEGLS